MIAEMTFSNVIVMFVNMLFNKEDNILIRNLYLLKGWTAQKLLKDFPSKSWNERNLWRMLKKLTHQFS